MENILFKCFFPCCALFICTEINNYNTDTWLRTFGKFTHCMRVMLLRGQEETCDNGMVHIIVIMYCLLNVPVNSSCAYAPPPPGPTWGISLIPHRRAKGFLPYPYPGDKENNLNPQQLGKYELEN